MLKQTARLALACFLATLAVLIAYLAVALISALHPESGRQQAKETGSLPIYICASLAHADIVLPLNEDWVNWNAELPGLELPQSLPDLYLAFGWGDLKFFRETPDWSDVRIPVAVMALLGQHDTALRVVVVRPPMDDPECIAVDADRAARQALATHALSTLVRRPDGGAQIQTGGSKFLAYFLARGTYSPFNTCNQWVADGLGKAGLPRANFAPFSFGVMWPLRHKNLAHS